MSIPDSPPPGAPGPPLSGDGSSADAGGPRALAGRDVAIVFLGLIGGLFLIFGGLAAVLAFLTIRGTLDLRHIDFSPSITINAAAFLVQALLMTAPVYFLVLRRRGLPFAAIGLRPFRRRWLLIVPLVAVVIVIVGEFASSLAGHPLETPMVRALAPRGFSVSGLMVMIAVAAIAVPFAEEVFFRGVLYTWLRGRWGPVAAVIVSSLVFGLFHMQPFWIVFAAFIGVALALIYEFSGSLWPAIGLHVINNTVSVVGLYLYIA